MQQKNSLETSVLSQRLMKLDRVRLQQRHEMAELFGFETRNKYALLDPSNTDIAFVAEQQKGILGFLLRSVFGHWRSFEIHAFNMNRKRALVLFHPFRWFFQQLEVRDSDGAVIGYIQQRFALLTKSFDVLDAHRKEIYQVRSPIWRIWTFTFTKRGREVAIVQKKWSGLLTEVFTDKDNFVLSYKDSSIEERDRLLILSAALFVDLQYFERKAR